jgi:tetratricopeptide (TPR) repeat protein
VIAAALPARKAAPLPETEEAAPAATPAGTAKTAPGPSAADAPGTARKPPARPEPSVASGAAPIGKPLEDCRSGLLRQRSRDALAACRQVFAGDPHSADAMVLLARADLLAGRATETLQLARRAVVANPRHADAYLLIGTVEQTEGRRQEARSAYQTYLELAPLGAHASDVRAILRTL